MIQASCYTRITADKCNQASQQPNFAVFELDETIDNPPLQNYVASKPRLLTKSSTVDCYL